MEVILERVTIHATRVTGLAMVFFRLLRARSYATRSCHVRGNIVPPRSASRTWALHTFRVPSLVALGAALA